MKEVYEAHLARFMVAHLASNKYPVDLLDYLEWDDVMVLELLKRNSRNVDAKAILERNHYRLARELTPKELAVSTLSDRLGVLNREFGVTVIVRNSAKQTVSLNPGDVLVVGEDGQAGDLISGSEILSSFPRVWYLRVYSDRENREAVRNRVEEIIRLSEKEI